MSKHTSPALLLLLLGLVVGFIAGWNNGIALLLIVIGGVLGIMALIKHPIFALDKSHGGHAIMLLIIIGVMMWFPVTLASVGTAKLPKADASLPSPTPITAPSGSQYTALLKVPLQMSEGSTFTFATSQFYFLDNSVVNDRYGFMKLLNDGNTGKLLAPGKSAPAPAMTVSSGAVSQTYLSGTPGSTIKFCGYQDTTPALAENASVCRDITLNGITSGSTPEWMWSFADGGNSQRMWNYPSFRGYDDTDTARTARHINRSSTKANDVFTFYVYPGTNGQGIFDGHLYVQASTANISNIVKVTITNKQTGAAQTYDTFPNTANIGTGPIFVAAPALASGVYTTTTNSPNVYDIGNFPGQTYRYGAQDQGKFMVEVTFNHPAAISSYLFQATENTHALSSIGGHFDWANSMELMTNDGTNPSSWV